MVQKINGADVDALAQVDGTGTIAPDFDPALIPRSVPDLPTPEALTKMVNVVLQPWAIESEETISGIIRDFVAEEIEQLGAMTTGQLAWSVAELVVARQAEITASGDNSATEGLLELADLARMFEHVFIASGGAALDGQPA